MENSAGYRIDQRYRLGYCRKAGCSRCECHFERVWRCRCPKASVLAAGKAHGVKVGYHGADMSKPTEIETMMAYAQTEFGGVDIPGQQRGHSVRGAGGRVPC